MSEKHDEFWKNFWQENGFDEEQSEPPHAREGERSQEEPQNLTIEYLNAEGEVIGTEEAPRPPREKPVVPEEKPVSEVFSEFFEPRPSPPQSDVPQQMPPQSMPQPMPPERPAAQKPYEETSAGGSAADEMIRAYFSRRPESGGESVHPRTPDRDEKEGGSDSSGLVPMDHIPIEIIPQEPDAPAPRESAPPGELPEDPLAVWKNVPAPAPAEPESRAEKRKRVKKEKEFEVDFDFDEAYQDVNEKVIKRGRTKRTGCLSGVLYFIFIISISVILAALGWMAARDVLGLGEADMPVTITVPRSAIGTKEKTVENDDGTQETKTVSSADVDLITDLLYDNGLVTYKKVFKLYCSFSHADEKIRAGTYVLNTDFDYRALVYGMTPTAGERVETDVTIPEGYTVYQIVKLLDENRVCDENELWDALANYDFDYDFLDKATLGDRYRLEGYLFPDTYTFYLGDTPSRVIGKLLTNFNRKWTEEMTEKAQELGYTQREVLTVASMIEKEAGGDEDRAKIASVIYNRLRDGAQGTYGYLQVDATIYYAIQGTDTPFSQDVDSPYNTYKVLGLPPGPIANPGLASIRAALEPAETDYYYYALGKNRLHEFFATYEEHQAFVHSENYGG